MKTTKKDVGDRERENEEEKKKMCILSEQHSHACLREIDINLVQSK